MAIIFFYNPLFVLLAAIVLCRRSTLVVANASGLHKGAHDHEALGVLVVCGFRRPVM